MQELTGSQLYNNYTVRCLLYTHSIGVSLQQTKEKKYDNGMQLFFLKLGLSLK